MSAAVDTPTGELLAELETLCARMPVPQSSRHPYVASIAACRNDFEHALALAAGSPAALELVDALLAGEVEPSFDPDASLALTAAWQRLVTLPVPEGQHPYLDDTLPALEALRLLLVALSHATAD